MLDISHHLRYQFLHPLATIPERSYEEAIGYDLHACLITESGNPSIAHILPWQTRAIPTGLKLLPPSGFYIGIYSRSGMALHVPPVFVANAPGVVDPDYRGEIKVILYNGGKDLYTVRHGERIAQAVLCPIQCVPLESAIINDVTARGDKGFGSTGR